MRDISMSSANQLKMRKHFQLVICLTLNNIKHVVLRIKCFFIFHIKIINEASTVSKKYYIHTLYYTIYICIYKSEMRNYYYYLCLRNMLMEDACKLNRIYYNIRRGSKVMIRSQNEKLIIIYLEKVVLVE